MLTLLRTITNINYSYGLIYWSSDNSITNLKEYCLLYIVQNILIKSAAIKFCKSETKLLRTFLFLTSFKINITLGWRNGKEINQSLELQQWTVEKVYFIYFGQKQNK